MSRNILLAILCYYPFFLFAQSISSNEPDPIEVSESLWNYGTAILTGHIHGYDESLGRTGTVQVMDVLLHQPKSFLIEINPSGDFYSEIPLLTSQEVVLWLLDRFHVILMTPGKHTEYDFGIKQNQRLEIVDKQFRGYNARLNTELRELDRISYFTFSDAKEKVINTDIWGFRDYCLNLMQMELDSLEQFKRNSNLSDAAYSIKKLGIQLDYYENIFFYHSRRHGALRSIGKEDLFRFEEVDPSFYDFIDSEVLNDEKVLLTGQKLNGFINKARYANKETKVDLLEPYKALLESIQESATEPSQSRMELIHSLVNAENLQEIDSIKSRYGDEWHSLESDYYQNFKELRTTDQWEKQDERFKEYLGLEDGLIGEIISARRFSTAHFIHGYQISREEIAQKIKDPFILKYVNDHLNGSEVNISIENKISANDDGKIISQYDQSEITYYLGSELNQFEGKLLYIDFWATWCGPCLKGIKKIKPLKEELRGKPIEFIYITNHTSRDDIYFEMIEDIEGTHFKIDDDNWNLLSARFSLGAIPHYMIVDQSGTIIHENFIPKSVSHIKKTLVGLLE